MFIKPHSRARKILRKVLRKKLREKMKPLHCLWYVKSHANVTLFMAAFNKQSMLALALIILRRRRRQRRAKQSQKKRQWVRVTNMARQTL